MCWGPAFVGWWSRKVLNKIHSSPNNSSIVLLRNTWNSLFAVSFPALPIQYFVRIKSPQETDLIGSIHQGLPGPFLKGLAKRWVGGAILGMKNLNPGTSTRWEEWLPRWGRDSKWPTNRLEGALNKKLVTPPPAIAVDLGLRTINATF